MPSIYKIPAVSMPSNRHSVLIKIFRYWLPFFSRLQFTHNHFTRFEKPFESKGFEPIITQLEFKSFQGFSSNENPTKGPASPVCISADYYKPGIGLYTSSTRFCATVNLFQSDTNQVIGRGHVEIFLLRIKSTIGGCFTCFDGSQMFSFRTNQVYPTGPCGKQLAAFMDF